MNTFSHTVFFTLKYPINSDGEHSFLNQSREVLPDVPGVKNFRIVKQESSKCSFNYGFVMEFEDKAAHQNYSNHPDHLAYVQKVWIPNVDSFQEIDFSDKN